MLGKRDLSYDLKKLLGVGLALLLVGACLSSGEEISLIAGETRNDPEAFGYALAGEEIMQGAPVLTVQAGEEVTICLENVHGRYDDAVEAHDLAILPSTADLPRGSDRSILDEVSWGVMIAGQGGGLLPGDSECFSFVPDDPGSYTYFCTFGGHVQQGMIGEFIVESG